MIRRGAGAAFLPARFHAGPGFRGRSAVTVQGAGWSVLWKSAE
jgi:hypothetical protein